MATYSAVHEKKVAVGLEGTYGVLGTMSRLIPGEFTFEYKRDSVVRPNFGNQTHDVQAYKKEGVLSASLTADADPNILGEVLSAWAGTKTVTAHGTQAYTHTFERAGTISDAFLSMSAKCNYGQGNVFDYSGLRVNTLTFNCENKGNMSVTANFIGKVETSGTAEPATVVYGTYAPWIFSQCTFAINGTLVNPRNFSVETNNALSEGFRVGTQFTCIKPLPSAKANTHVKFAVDAEDMTWRNIYLANTNQPLVITVEGDTLLGTYKTQLKFTLPSVNFMTAPFEMADGLLGLAVDGVALDGTNATGTGAFKIDLTNMITGY